MKKQTLWRFILLQFLFTDYTLLKLCYKFKWSECVEALRGRRYEIFTSDSAHKMVHCFFK